MCPPLGTWSETQVCALKGNHTSDPLVLRLVLNPLSYTSQGSPKVYHVSIFSLLLSKPSSNFKHHQDPYKLHVLLPFQFLKTFPSSSETNLGNFKMITRISIVQLLLFPVVYHLIIVLFVKYYG